MTSELVGLAGGGVSEIAYNLQELRGPDNRDQKTRLPTNNINKSSAEDWDFVYSVEEKRVNRVG